MNVRKEAEADLRGLVFQRESIQSLAEQIEVLQLQFEGVRSARTDKEPVTGGSSRREEKIDDNIVKRAILADRQRAMQMHIARIEKGLAMLTGEERMILEAFYVQPMPNRIKHLMLQTGYEQAHIYRLRERAIKKFTQARYGLLDG